MALAPENSAASFALAQKSGADEIELDVRVTGDGVPIVLHDRTLKRLAAEPGPFVDTPVDQLSLAQLHTVALSGGQRALTFAEVLAMTEVDLQVEIKDASAVHAMAKLLANAPEHKARIKFSSFLPEALFLLNLYLPAVPRGLIVGTFPATRQQRQELDEMLITTGVSTLYSGFGNLTKADVRRLHTADIDIHVWPLTCAQDVRRALELGSDGGTADDPAKAMEWLAAERTSTSPQTRKASWPDRTTVCQHHPRDVGAPKA
jgi:glycerophosphoryl diester phosphodiesterase